MKRGPKQDRWAGLEELLGTCSDLELAIRYQCGEGSIARKRVQAGIRRQPRNGSMQQRSGPSEEDCARWNEAAAERRMQELGAGGMASIAGDCADCGWSWEVGG